MSLHSKVKKGSVRASIIYPIISNGRYTNPILGVNNLKVPLLGKVNILFKGLGVV